MGHLQALVLALISSCKEAEEEVKGLARHCIPSCNASGL